MIRTLKVAEEIYSVSELNRVVRRLIEDGLPALWVEGEISNYKPNKSGHLYFTLKDANAQLPCVMWRTRRKPDFELTGGLKIRAFGQLTVWEQGGRYQFDAQMLTRAGLGDLHATFEELKRKLSEEGIFDTERKKKLPVFPQSIGIVTSPTGAAIHDLVWSFKDRFPPAELFLIPVAVQGEGAAADIAKAICDLNKHHLVDVIVTGRGGGSLEDLWAFNEEILVRAISASEIPVVSAVGHEIDVTLSDLVADLRAPTPTAAASLVVPDRRELSSLLSDKKTRLSKSLTERISWWRDQLNILSRGYGMRQVSNRILNERMRLEDASRHLEDLMAHKVNKLRLLLNGSSDRLRALSPLSVLDRGYCVARTEDGSVVKDYREAHPGKKLRIIFRKGVAVTKIEETMEHDFN